jgi:hypothetical protein
MNIPLQTKASQSYQSNHQSGRSRQGRELGIVQGVDLVRRDLTVLLQSGVEVFDIPPDCPIVLRGEQIKLRMVQPRDHVWLKFHRTPERAVAEKVEVQPDTGFSCFRL